MAHYLLRFITKISVQKIGILAAAVLCQQAQAFESTKVLPKGVRNVTIRTVDTKVTTKTSQKGEVEPIAEPLNKALTFDKIIRGEKGVKKNLARGGMDYLGLTEADSVGDYNADLRAHVRVIAPIIAYGLTDKLTLAIAVPWYQAATNVDVGFQPSALGQSFINRLSGDPNYQLSAAHVAGNKLNDAVGELQKKLTDNGYKNLDSWRQSAWGDTTLAAKYLLFTSEHFKTASTLGVVAPTGRKDDPNILTDLPFSDGSWDSFAQIIFDFPITKDVVVNQFSKYTYQFKNRREIRLVTEAEAIEGSTDMVTIKMGDHVTSGASLQYEPRWGLVTGIGAEYFRKFGDRYDTEDLVAEKYQKDTAQTSWRNTVKLGFSTVPLYQDKKVAVPFIISAMYSQHKSSVSMPTNDILTVDVNLYF